VPKSPFFQRIKSDVLRIVAAIPDGRIATYRAIGEHLDVVPRHVAYILSTLDNSEKKTYPWYRVVGENGKLGSRKIGENGESQSELLQYEGITVLNDTVVGDLLRIAVAISKLRSGVPKQIRPANTPSPKVRSKGLGSS
jgi:methylated-DNA-protein-cysteine methyltransferase related protein